MKPYYLIAIISACLGVAIYSSDEPNDLQKRQIEVEQMISELPKKEEELRTKKYHGRIDQIDTQRIIDVNNVYVYAKDLNIKAVQVCNDIGLKIASREAVKRILNKKKEALEQQKNNNEIIKFVNDIMNDPNIQPDPDDPNYAYQTQLNKEFQLAVIESCKPR